MTEITKEFWQLRIAESRHAQRDMLDEWVEEFNTCATAQEKAQQFSTLFNLPWRLHHEPDWKPAGEDRDALMQLATLGIQTLTIEVASDVLEAWQD